MKEWKLAPIVSISIYKFFRRRRRMAFIFSFQWWKCQISTVFLWKTVDIQHYSWIERSSNLGIYLIGSYLYTAKEGGTISDEIGSLMESSFAFRRLKSINTLPTFSYTDALKLSYLNISTIYQIFCLSNGYQIKFSPSSDDYLDQKSPFILLKKYRST